ncbi:caspase family protein [Pseudomonas frederiksbergensis]|uniref:caspase family protein n=1 Tax=Pseudomonas frederiksbergensis TaxID=104087 RepID=UPI0032E3F8EE
MNLAIVVGVSQYDNYTALKACENEAGVMYEILTKLNKFDDVCFISGSPKAHEAKQKITEFVNKHKSSVVDELVFYFTGHGGRFDDDFFYIFSDFHDKKKETTGLRNSELDGLIRNLSPGLTVKIVDACYSGTTYVKSDSEIQPILEKSAKDSQLNKLYFLHSSSSEEESLATESFSLFSRSLFKSLAQNEGLIRHRDIMAYVADDMDANGFPKPTFIVQADNTEFFGDVNAELIQYINGALGVLPSGDKIPLKAEQAKEKPAKTFLELVKLKSSEEYCDQKEGVKNIELIMSSFQKETWPKVITDIFNVSTEIVEHRIPNEPAIARWLIKNQDEKYFVEPAYETRTYYKDEYIEVPKKPESKKVNDLFGAHQWAKLMGSIQSEVEYKLEKVEKKQQVLNGIQFTAVTPFKALQVKFEPKFSSVENYALTIVPIFSRKLLAIFYSIEVLNYTSWDYAEIPKCSEWKIRKVGLKRAEGILKYCADTIALTEKFIVDDVSLKLKE